MNDKSVRVVAIDGPAASGKSTVARMVAARLKDGVYINTGDMYRAITWIALEAGIAVDSVSEQAMASLLSGLDLQYELDSSGLPVLLLNGQPVPQDKIRAPEVAAQVSLVARLEPVRNWLVERQRATVRLGVVVMEGRDIGTIVFPHAQYKFFLTASPLVRARRRLEQAGETPHGATVDSVALEIAARDRLDSSRAIAPMKPAADAMQIDSSNLTLDEVTTSIIAHIPERMRG